MQSISSAMCLRCTPQCSTVPTCESRKLRRIQGAGKFPASYSRYQISPTEPCTVPKHGRSGNISNIPHWDQTQTPSALLSLDESLFADFLSSWDDELPELPGLDDQIWNFPFELPQSDAQLSSPSPDRSSDHTEKTAPPSAPEQGSFTDSGSARPNKRPRTEGIPTHLLAQHYSRALAGRFSFKRPDWTFYTYFYHRFARSHPIALSAILAWTSANLFFVGQATSLHDAISHYDDSISLISKKYGISLPDCKSWRDMVGHSRNLSSQSDDDRDALFVACFFLALLDLALARSGPLLITIRFIASLLQSPEFKERMTGVQARVLSWFCILDGKASAFQPGEGAILQAIGSEEEIVELVRVSSTTLQDAYSITYPEEERKSDERQHPLLELMLRLSFLLHIITSVKGKPRVGYMAKDIRSKLNSYCQAIDQDIASSRQEGRNRYTYLVLRALYHSIEISYSRCLVAGDQRHAADQHACDIIRITQQLKALRPVGSKVTPPPTKFWPLPLVMAAIEVRDPVYREWAVRMLADYETVGGDHYTWSRRFVEAMCEREDQIAQRLDWSSILAEIKDGLVI
ncbi:hypothetical protein N7481_004868 [Penicillium waksmanii]|uniref:uncharacterized protein n=1 Tax=Penicillium waksmanii TaxID=69791 RepID=UPI00254921C9|nr:uncharacterized protein N7481_004868 [Penicillium waksmanii]KAJ5989658.1 hypothetical protein N7481_004868 [Penicillium waksmanii]